MCIEGQQAFPDRQSTVPATGVRDVAVVLPVPADGCVSRPGNCCAPFSVPYVLICVILGAIYLLFLHSGVEILDIQAIESIYPAVGLTGLFRSKTPLIIKRWMKRNGEDNDSEDDPEPLVAGAPPGRYALDDDRTSVLERLESTTDALQRFDEFVSSGGLITVPPSVEPPAEPSVDAPGDRASPGETDLLLPTEEPEAKALLDVPFPDELPSTPSNDLPAPCPGSFSDGELMQMLGFDDGASLPGIAEFDLDPLGEESADTAARGDERSIESLIDDLGSDDAGIRGHAVRAIAERGADAVEPLVQALALAGDGERWCVAEALALIGEDSISALITALGDVTAQIGAAATLVRIGSPAVPPLIAALAGDDSEVQFGARYALREIGDAAIPSLIEALGAPERDVRRSAASILRELGWKAPADAGAIRYLIADEAWLDVADYGEAAIDPLICILKSPERGMWWNAARTLGEIGEAAVDPLVELLHEVDDEIHPLVAMALTEIGSPAVEALIGLLSVPSICGTAMTALVKIGEPAVEGCIHSLESADDETQEALRNVLGALGEPAIPALIQTLMSGQSRTRPRVVEILNRMNWEPWNDAERAWYLIAREEWMELARMGAPAVEPLIRTLNGDNDRIRCEAAATLGEIGDPAAVGPLVGALASRAVAPAATDALVAIGRPVIVPVLGLLEDGTGAARENAVEVLGRLGAPEAIPAIVELIRTGEDRLHRRAIDALVEIGAPAVDALIPLLAGEGDGLAGAAAALTGIGRPGLGSLTRALSDENSSIRAGAARILKEIGWAPEGGTEEIVYLIALQRWPEVVKFGAPAVDLLVVRLGDLDPGVQAGATEALVSIGVPAISPLIGLFDSETLRDPAIETLVGIGEPAVGPLILALEMTWLRKAAAGVLVRIGEPAANALVPVLGHPEIGQTTAGILGAMGEEALDALVGALGNADALIRRRAGDALTGFGEAAVPPLIRALGDPDDTLRLGAIDALALLGSPAVDLLTQALNDERYLVRLGAAEVLDRTGWEPQTESETVCYLIAKEQWGSVAGIGSGAVELLIQMLNDSDSGIQAGAARALGMIGTPAATRLIYELRTEQNEAQRKAIEALKMIGEPAVIPLINALQDRDWQIRLGAARALVGIRDPAVEPLVLALRVAPPVVRMGAAATLGKIGNPAAIEPLIDALLQDDQRLGHVVVRAFGMIGAPAVRPLLRVLKDGDEASRKGAVAALVLIGEPATGLLPGALTDEHFRARAGAADALDCLGWSPGTEEEMIVYLIAKERWGDLIQTGAAAVEALVHVLDDRDDSIRRRATKTLGEIGDPRAVLPLMNLLHDDYYSVRREAGAAIVAIGAPAVELVISALDDPDGDIRKRAADVLAEIGDARAIAPLERIFGDEDWYARKAAENAVKRIRERVEIGTGNL